MKRLEKLVFTCYLRHYLKWMFKGYKDDESDIDPTLKEFKNCWMRYDVSINHCQHIWNTMYVWQNIDGKRTLCMCDKTFMGSHIIKPLSFAMLLCNLDKVTCLGLVSKMRNPCFFAFIGRHVLYRIMTDTWFHLRDSMNMIILMIPWPVFMQFSFVFCLESISPVPSSGRHQHYIG